MLPLTRRQIIKEIDPKLPLYRLGQIQIGLFNPRYKDWFDISTISVALKEQLSERIPWMSLKKSAVVVNESKDTYKALLVTSDHLILETVLMKNSTKQWTLCLSSQIGCAMKCVFCATGTMGLKRSLNSDEIVDQYRFWQSFVEKNDQNKTRISNMVIMGMGEPLANYDNIKEALNTILKYSDLGGTKITVSSVGLLNQLNFLLDDPEWPAVRMAISLHAPNQVLREKIVPSTPPDFFLHLKEWSRAYLKKHGNRKHHLTFEYIMIDGINDQDEHARQLANYANSIGNVKINLIPYNTATDSGFKKSQENNSLVFKKILESKGITVSVRKSRGESIAAACGQLVIKK